MTRNEEMVLAVLSLSEWKSVRKIKASVLSEYRVAIWSDTIRAILLRFMAQGKVAKNTWPNGWVEFKRIADGSKSKTKK